MKPNGFFLTLAMLAISSVHADAIYDNLNIDGTYLASGGSVIRGEDALGPIGAVSQAVSFTPTETVQLDRIEVGMHDSSQSIGDATEFVLYDRAPGGGPGAVVESFGIQSGFPAQFSSDSALAMFSSSTKPLLQAGTEYFIVGVAGNNTASSTWMDNPTGAGGSWARSGGGAWNAEPSVAGALRIFAVPEPSSAILLALGGLAWGRRRVRYAD